MASGLFRSRRLTRYEPTRRPFYDVTTEQAKGAFPNTTRVVNLKADIATPVKALGTVKGSSVSGFEEFAYFIVWDQTPETVSFAFSRNIARVP